MNKGMPLRSKKHPQPVSKVKATNMASSTHKMMDGGKYVNKLLNAHRQQPGFKGKVV